MSPTRELLLGTNNNGKIRELRRLLHDLPFQLRDLTEFPSIGCVPETGNTFAENASRKAIGYARQTGLLTLADDSGLEVDGLGGAPGVLSARYGGASDAERRERLLRELVTVPDHRRGARFVSVIAIANEEADLINFSTGVCRGRITRSPRGSHGFGYDPIFIPQGYDATFGELPPALKNRISHRSQAISQAREFLHGLTAQSADG